MENVVHRTRLALVAIVLGAGLTGCGGGADELGASPTEVEEAVVPEPTPEADMATVEEWGSLIAVEQDRVDEAMASWDDAICSATAVAAGAPDCGALMTAMAFVADTTAIIVTGAGDSASPTYLGEVPDELTALVEETQGAADAASTAGQEAIDGCPGEDCAGVAIRFSTAFADLRASLVAWAPYL